MNFMRVVSLRSICREYVPTEAGEDYIAERARYDKLAANRGDGNMRGLAQRISVDACADGRKSNAAKAFGPSQLQRAPVGGREQLVLSSRPTPPRPDRMYDESCRKVEPGSQASIPGGARREACARTGELRAGGGVNGAAYSAARRQRCVGGVHDGVDVESRDIDELRAENLYLSFGGALVNTIADTE